MQFVKVVIFETDRHFVGEPFNCSPQPKQHHEKQKDQRILNLLNVTTVSDYVKHLIMCTL